MTLGMRPRKGGWMTANRGGIGAVAAQIAACGAFALLLAGCGGGGGGGGSNNNGATPTPSAGGVTVTGTVLDNISGAPAPGVVVAFGKYYALVSSGGTFSLSIPAATSGVLQVYGEDTLDSSGNVVLGSNGLPTTTGYYRDTGTYLGVYTSLSVAGIPISATTSGQTVALGTITVLNLTEPPGPPVSF